MAIAKTVLESVGNTNLIRLNRVSEETGCNIYGKAEFLNPVGSMKDRIALRMIEAAEARGELRPGMPVVEVTSGNTGIGLSLVCAQKGYRFIACMSEGNTVERRIMLQRLGAELELVPQGADSIPGKVSGDDLKLVENRAREIVRERGAFFTDQFNNPDNAAAHEFGTGPEIADALDGKVDYFIAVVGTSGTFTGVSRALKRRIPGVRCVAVEPECAPVLAGGKITGIHHLLQGSSYAYVPSLWDGTLCDAYMTVTDGETIDCCRELAAKEGVLCGYTSGGVLAAAKKLAAGAPRGSNIVFILCDSGMRYLSSDLYK
jgi:cysteine synthase A